MSELYPLSYQYPAMLINKQPTAAELDRMIASGDYLISRKYDGFWYQLEKIDDDHIYLFSRSKSRKTGELTEKIECVPHIKSWAKLLPDDTILVGEVYVEGGKSNNVTSIMGALPARAAARQYDTDEYGGPLHYYIHDILRCDGQDLMELPLEERIDQYLYYWIGDLFSHEEYIHAAEYYSSKEDDTLFTYVDFHTYIDDVFADGGEGVVLKNRHEGYQPGKRPTFNKKVKTETTFDVFITGFVEPEKEYTGKEIETWSYWVDGTAVTKAYHNGWKAGIKVGVWDGDKIVSVGTISSGMTDFLRQDMAENPYNYMNKVVEIQAMSVDKTEHTIRHGRLMRIRDDKTDVECTLESVFS